MRVKPHANAIYSGGHECKPKVIAMLACPIIRLTNPNAQAKPPLLYTPGDQLTMIAERDKKVNLPVSDQYS